MSGAGRYRLTVPHAPTSHPKRVLILATYPIRNPVGGGQKRVAAIVDVYRRAGHDARFVALYNRNHYSEHGPHDIALPKDTAHQVNTDTWIGDILVGKAVMSDPALKARLTATLQETRPEIIQVEHPFLYLGVRPLLDELGLAPRIIFSSHNIEAPMRREILENLGYEEEYVEDAVAAIDDAERRLSADAELVLACTQADLETHQRYGARRTVLAENGIAELRPQPGAVQHWRDTFTKQGVDQIAVFVASAHPPALTGFLDVVGKDIGFLTPRQRIVAAGGIGDMLTWGTHDLDIRDVTFPLRTHRTGRLSQDRLAGLLGAADVLLLPITEGGGSNLKTAEAVAADKKVVTTSHALRSFEWFADFPNVWVADTKDDFHDAISRAFDAPRRERTAQQREQAAQVLWPERMRNFEAEVSAL